MKTSFLRMLLPNKLIAKINAKLYAKYGKSHSEGYQYNLNIQYEGRCNGKVTLITGATGAIGSAIALRLSLEGAIVGIGGRTLEKINNLVFRIKEIYPEAKLQPVILDVLNDLQIEDAIRNFANKNGRLDILINNAGGGSRSSALPLRDQTIQVLDCVLNTNLRGSILCAKVASEIMVSQLCGKIISMSSVMGINGKENWCEYSSSKAGILGLTKSLALELGEYNITVNAVSPGMVFQIPFDRHIPKRFTQTNALKRFGYTDEVASLVAFLCSDEANYITGQNFVVDGGRSIGLKNN